MKRKIICLCIVLMAFGIGCSNMKDKNETKIVKKESTKQEQAVIQKKKVQITELSFERISGTEICVSWLNPDNEAVLEYQLMRKEPKAEEWINIGKVDAKDGQTEYSFTDVLENASAKQYLYRVDVKVKDKEKYEGAGGSTIIASNVLICIDPGHYAGKNTIVDSDGSSYSEGDFVLGLAKNLAGILKSDYGISVTLTRETGTITMEGYTDENLDKGHISLRGESAAQSNLFISLHTNANLENANGYPTQQQPVELDKPIIIVNRLACEDGHTLGIANAIGEHLARVSAENGIAAVAEFQRVSSADEITEWTDSYNDSLNVKGTVCVRWWDNSDYYGVLRGADEVGVPGMIIEHGYHTVLEVRGLAKEGKLEEIWAQADAKGLAEGFDFTDKREE